jgi:hypothetical protein
LIRLVTGCSWEDTEGLSGILCKWVAVVI